MAISIILKETKSLKQVNSTKIGLRILPLSRKLARVPHMRGDHLVKEGHHSSCARVSKTVEKETLSMFRSIL